MICGPTVKNHGAHLGLLLHIKMRRDRLCAFPFHNLVDLVVDDLIFILVCSKNRDIFPGERGPPSVTPASLSLNPRQGHWILSSRQRTTGAYPKTRFRAGSFLGIDRCSSGYLVARKRRGKTASTAKRRNSLYRPDTFLSL